MATTGDFILPIGKRYRGQALSEIPTEYLDWLLGEDWVWESTKDKIEAHLATRADWKRIRKDND